MISSGVSESISACAFSKSRIMRCPFPADGLIVTDALQSIYDNKWNEIRAPDCP